MAVARKGEGEPENQSGALVAAGHHTGTPSSLTGSGPHVTRCWVNDSWLSVCNGRLTRQITGPPVGGLSSLAQSQQHTVLSTHGHPDSIRTHTGNRNRKPDPHTGSSCFSCSHHSNLPRNSHQARHFGAMEELQWT